MDIKNLQKLIELRKPILRKQLVRRYQNESIVDDALDNAFTTLLLKTDLFKPEKGSFNTYYFNVCSNYCKTEFERLNRFVSLSQPEVDLVSYYESPYSVSLESYQEWLFTAFPELIDVFVYNEDNDIDPYAEEKLTTAVKKIANIKLEKYNVSSNDLFGIFDDAAYRIESFGESGKKSWKLLMIIAKNIRDTMCLQQELVQEWGKQIVAN